ncbi:MAG: TonB-dependent receptor [Myxococcota bacterium]
MHFAPLRRSSPLSILIALAAVSLVALVPGIAASQSNDADADADPWAGVDELVVYGSQAYGLTKDASVAVTSFNTEDLLEKGITDIPSLAQFTPNLEIKTTGATTPIFFIRGVGLNDFTANAAGAVAIYVDDIPLNLPAFQAQPVYDTADVQVLKGPQGSGAGRNASAGAIKSYSKRPTGDFEGYLQFDYGNYNFIYTEGAVDVPVIPDVLAARLSFRYQKRDGTFTNRCGDLPGFNASDPSDPINLRRVVDPTIVNQQQCGEPLTASANETFTIPNPNAPPNTFEISSIPAGLDRDLNNVFNFAARAQLRFTPTETQDWTLNLHGFRADQLGTVGQPLGTNGNVLGDAVGVSFINPDVRVERDRLVESRLQPLRDQGLPIDSIRCRRTPGCLEARDAAIASADATLGRRLSRRPLDKKPFDGDINLPGHERIEIFGTSLRGEIEFDNFLVRSITGWEQYRRSQIRDFDFTSATLFEFFIDDKAWQVTQDIQFEGELDITPLTWKAGAFFIAERLDYDQFTSGGGDIQSLSQIFRQDAYGVGAFADIEWEFADDFELIAGVRVNWEKKSFDIREIFSARDRCTPLANGSVPKCETARTFTEPTGSVALKYTISEDAAVYWKYSRGWKGHQFNISDGATRSTFTEALPETIDAYEVGFNASWFEGMLESTGAFFWYRYDNYQVFLFTNDFSSPPQRIVQNANEAQLYGAELDLDFEPIERLEFKLSLGWLESKFLDFSDSGIRRIVLGPENDPPVIISEVPIDFTGNRLPNTPRFKVTGSIKYDFELGTMGRLTPRWDYTYTDEIFFDPSNGQGAPSNLGELFLPANTIGQRGLFLQNARLTYSTSNDMLQAAFWIRNLTNEVYKEVSFDASATAGLVGSLVGLPRTYGLSAKFKF